MSEQRKPGFEGYVDHVTVKLTEMVPLPSRSDGFRYRDQFKAQLRALAVLAKDGAKFTAADVVDNHSAYLEEFGGFSTRPAWKPEVDEVLSQLKKIGVVSYAPTFRNWRLSEAGRRAIDAVLPHIGVDLASVLS